MDDISEFIRNNRERSLVYVEEWQKAVKKYNIPPFRKKDEFIAWCTTNNLNSLVSLWIGREIQQALNTVPTAPAEPETPPDKPPGFNPLDIIGLALSPLLLRDTKKLMEDDPKFKKIEEDLKKEWQKNNPGKDFSSKEGIDYLHGNLDNPDAPTLRSDAEKTFREKNPKKAASYDKEGRRVYKNHGQDPAVASAKRKIEEHTKARGASFEQRINDQEWDRFAKKYPEKAKDYRNKLEDVARALERHEIRQLLSEYAKRPKGKEVKLTEKVKREPPKISIDEATKRLEAIQPHIPTGQIYVPHVRPLGAAPVRSTSIGFRPRKRGVVDHINDSRRTLSSIKRAGSSLRAINVAIKTVGQIITKPFPWVWIVVIIILLIVLFQLFFGGGTGLSFDLDDSQNPSLPGSPGSQITSGLDYYIPFRDSTITPQNIRSEILGSWPNAQIDNWDIIVSESVANGWNPAFLLALWIEESGAQGVQAADALGCDPSNPYKDIYGSLNCVFGSFRDYTNDRFADFMCRYGGDNFGDAPCTFIIHNPNFPKNVRFWYEKLVPTGPGALVEVIPPGIPPLEATCPIRGGTAANVTCGSYFTLRNNCGHCRPDAGYADFMGNCNYNAIYYAEDIGGAAGQDIILPSINGAVIDWNLISVSPSSIGSIRYFSGVNRRTNEEYWIQFHHVDVSYGITSGKSGDVGARICTTGLSCNHVHVEFSIVTPGGGRIPQDAPLFLCI